MSSALEKKQTNKSVLTVLAPSPVIRDLVDKGVDCLSLPHLYTRSLGRPFLLDFAVWMCQQGRGETTTHPSSPPMPLGFKQATNQ